MSIKPSTQYDDHCIGKLIIAVVQHLEQNEIPVVYLRNYQSLPNDIGNDVDLLIPAGKRQKAATLIKQYLADTEWRVVQQIEFSPLSLFLAHQDFTKFIHIDLFDRIEWHWLEYADAESIIREREWNGIIYHPAEHHEVIINFMTRLIYQGVVREKHRHQAFKYLSKNSDSAMLAALSQQIGSKKAKWVAGCIRRQDWEVIERSSTALRATLVAKKCLNSPLSCFIGFCRYLKRSLSRIMHPPGPMIVFEGADGVGKTTLIEKLVPYMQALTGRKDVLLFHWKPNKKSMRLPGQPLGKAMCPRAKAPRPASGSLVYLIYHWLGFWIGYLKHLLPARVSNRAVMSDRYAYEFEIDPHRLRLNLPAWTLKLASRFSPAPSLTFALICNPDTIRSRKTELSVGEIEAYQDKLLALSKACPCIHRLDANKSIDEVCDEALEVLRQHLFKN